MLHLNYPIVVEELRSEVRTGYKFGTLVKDYNSILTLSSIYDDVFTMTESGDIEMIIYYEDYISKINKN